MRYRLEQRMDRLEDSRLSRMLRLAYVELDAVTMSRQYYALRSLHWLPVRRRVTFKSAIIAWKCVNGVAPTYLRELCVPVEDVRCRLDLVYGLRQLAAFQCLEFRPLLDSEASHTADLWCGTISYQPCANICHGLRL